MFVVNMKPMTKAAHRRKQSTNRDGRNQEGFNDLKEDFPDFDVWVWFSSYVLSEFSCSSQRRDPRNG